MNENKYNDTKKVTARNKAKLMKLSSEAGSKNEVLEIAKAIAVETAKKTRLDGSVSDLAMALFACGESARTLANAETVEAFMVANIRWKLTIADKLNDTGAIGDAIETLVHLLAMRKAWRTQKRNLHVSAIGKTDVRIGGIKFEVGHNAKLWNDATIEDAMNGPFEGVIYGMIDREEIDAIVEIMKVDFVRGVTEIANLLYVFTDKNEYLEVMQNDLGRSPTLKYREDLNKIVTVYNPSKYKAWIDRMEGKEFPTLTEYMKSLGENDYLK